ncbi:putative oxidoreductase [Lasiodiplodia hormozganensis]|uniref:Oxidoreductase n=1 Tax=Lasiodiplodia hormozganensis TaxID=869390 RepID=A0AA39WZJ8_9PEZI|nr:putative oxidoreductase [Lasiodiplodia hormozganensis]
MASVPKFNSQSTAAEVAAAFPDSIKGRNILITGVGPGGLSETLIQTLADHAPATLYLAGRTPAKVNAIASSLQATHPAIQTRVIHVDLASFASIRAAAAQVTAPLHLLINNAGVMNVPTRTLSAYGYEMHLAVNYLGLFLLTNLLVPRLPQGARVMNVASSAHTISPFRFADYNFDDGKGEQLPEEQRPNKAALDGFGLPYGLGYVPPVAYGASKTAVVLYTGELARRVKGRGVAVTCVNPGPIATELWREMPEEVRQQVFANLRMRSKEQGVADYLVAALHPGLSDGAYVENCEETDVAPFAKDSRQAQRLWELSEELVRDKFAF